MSKSNKVVLGLLVILVLIPLLALLGFDIDRLVGTSKLFLDVSRVVGVDKTIIEINKAITLLLSSIIAGVVVAIYLNNNRTR